MRVISTECSKEQQEKDMPELLRLNEQAKKTELMWEFFGGTLTTQDGNRYQVCSQEKRNGIRPICGNQIRY